MRNTPSKLPAPPTTERSVSAALEWLEDENWIKSEEGDRTGPGRRTTRYRINPKVKVTDVGRTPDAEATHV